MSTLTTEAFLAGHLNRVIEERDAALAKLAEIRPIASHMASECGDGSDWGRGYESASVNYGDKLLEIIDRPAAQADEGVKG
jgi:hypothetical protein